eukprot:6735918-Alexandrium_andersonii.AAC.1
MSGLRGRRSETRSARCASSGRPLASSAAQDAGRLARWAVSLRLRPPLTVPALAPAPALRPPEARPAAPAPALTAP